jgi:hypothetical protein
MELLTAVGEQAGCLAALAALDAEKLAKTDLLELVLAPARR